MIRASNKITFSYKGWECWQNDSNGDWGAILSRKGEQPLIIDGLKSRDDLIAVIDKQ